MAKGLSYADAVRLLGGDSAWVEVLSRIATAGLSTVPGAGAGMTFLGLRSL
jgi:hypothetical protein